SLFGDHAQIAWPEIEMNLPACPGIEMDTLESTQCDAGRAFHRWKLEIKLHNLIACELARVNNCHVGAHRLSRGSTLGRYFEIAVAEVRVTKAVTKRIEWLAREVTIGPVRHPIVFKIWKLIDALIEGNRQPTSGIVLPA